MTEKDQLTKHQRYQMRLTALATVGGIVTVLIGILSYRSEQKQTRAAQERATFAQQTASERDAKLLKADIQRRIEELNAHVWEQRLETYSRVARDAATIAVTCDADPKKEVERFSQFQVAAHNFWQAYWGDMSLIEDNLVEIAMIIYGEAVDAWEKQRESDNKTLTAHDMRNLSYYLAHVYRKSLSRTWNPEHAFDKEVLIDKPLHKMYEIAMNAGLDVQEYEGKVGEYDK